ncbi:HlyD family efflux transporter periplasmic adaptor subunit [uncultured Subdoligranulum sp.]|uniref:HlyD family efflux transporter periplasmic adaptor subunit n=1 Tax=uncultured Subdoligranulum sp. TaxID=512298 RepID=UPI00260019B0|nr:HlyD family efflux transporter periplasmic adaptor subunit [uncultured Subdoligranulum sp.]
MDHRDRGRRAAVRAALVMGGMLLALAAVYIVLQLYAILGRTYQTETAISASMEDTVPLSGIAMFDAVPVQGSGSLGYLVEDGERVTEGTVLAEIYTDPAQSTQREELDRLDRIIDLLTKSENSVGSDLALLTAQTRTALLNLLDQLDTASYTGMSDAIDEFLLAQNRLQISTGQSSGFTATLADLQTQRDAAAAALEGLQTITADRNGYFISTAAALPLDLTEDTLKSDTAAALSERLQQEIPTTGSDLAGRIVTGFSWRFYGVCDLDTAARFDGVTSVKIRVPGKQDEALDATVTEVAADETAGLAKITLECRTINADVLRLGREDAEIVLNTYEGIRVSKRAMHIVDGERGVYVKYGSLQRFRRIVVLFEDENYLLLDPEAEDNEVRLYDEIIVEGPNLQDGGLV